MQHKLILSNTTDPASNQSEQKNPSKRKRIDELLSESNKLFKPTIPLNQHSFYSLLNIFSKHKGKLEDIIKELDIVSSYLQEFINSQLSSTREIKEPSPFKMMLEIGKMEFSYQSFEAKLNKPFKYYRFPDRKKMSELLTSTYLKRHLDSFHLSEFFKSIVHSNLHNPLEQNTPSTTVSLLETFGDLKENVNTPHFNQKFHF